MPFPTYTVATETANGDIDQASVHDDLSALQPDSIAYSGDGLSMTLHYAVEPSPGDIISIDAIIAAHAGINTLAKVKSRKVVEIDNKTDSLIALGFTYASKQFSLSMTAQTKMMGTHQVKDDLALVYPINWNTIDDIDAYSIADSADLDGFYLTGLGTIRAHLDSGTALKDSVRAAVDIAGVDAVVDNR